MSSITWRLAFGLFATAWVCFSHAEAAVSIVVPQEKRRDAGLMLAVTDVQRAVPGSAIVNYAPPAKLPAGDLILIGRLKEVPSLSGPPLKPEAFRIRAARLADRKSVVIEGDQRGMMYGAFKLAERIRLGADPFAVAIESAPKFPLRMFSEEGQLLDLPDIAYYSDKAPYVNEERLRAEIDETKRLIDHVARLGFNTVTFLHVNCEDYIDYKYLDKPIYADGDRHLVRSPVFCRYMSELCDYAHVRHIDVFLQLYEIQYPPKVDRLYRVDLNSPNIQKIITAKCKELFERVPLDGLVITPTESHPRCGYAAKMLWRGGGQPGAGRMMTMYHEACHKLKKKVVFRMWRVATDAAGARQALKYAPADAMVSVKNTGGDFYLSSEVTNIITAGVGLEHPLMVVFDPFREFDGWSQLFCYMKRYGETMKVCHEKGVQAINAWGAWNSGCIWPDWEPGYMTNMDGSRQTGKPVSWVSDLSYYRMFTRGFTPGQGNVYLLGRLAWDPSLSSEAVARDFATLHIGAANAEAAARAMMLSQDAFREYYLGPQSVDTHPVYIKWATNISVRPQFLEQGYKNFPIDKLMASNKRALDAVNEMKAIFSKTSRNAAHDAARYDEFKDGIDRTSLYLRSLFGLREFLWRQRLDRDLNGKEQRENRIALETIRTRLQGLIVEWKRFPREAGDWRITFRYHTPAVERRGVFPSWYSRGEATTMEGIIRKP